MCDTNSRKGKWLDIAVVLAIPTIIVTVMILTEML